MNNSEIIDINNNIILNQNKLYYELKEDDIKSGLQIKANNIDCFIEILYSSKDYSEILEGYS